MNAALTAFLYDCTLLKVTRPDPIGYLCLSVSIPVTEGNHSYNYISKLKKTVDVSTVIIFSYL